MDYIEEPTQQMKDQQIKVKEIDDKLLDRMFDVQRQEKKLDRDSQCLRD